jgi:phosphoribosyl 1,2-cyclic phosphodiesterase
MMRIRFWGTRGSLATPGPTTLRYGGNTSCVEARAADGTLIVLDCGTGAHRLGQALVAEAKRLVRGHLLITHTHWDHIQGFPFFAPVFAEGSEWDLYAPGGLGEGLEAVLSAQMQHPYFPVTLAQLAATIRYHNLVEGALTVGGVRVVAQYLNHPALTLGYRLEADGDPYFRKVPIVLLTAEAGAEKTQEGFAAGITDYLTKPFKAPFVRARVRAWLERVGADSDRGA